MMSNRSRSLAYWVVLVCLLLAAMPATAASKTKLTVGTWLNVEDWKNTYREAEVFAKNNPDIELDVVMIAGFNDYATKLAVLAATGDVPDVLQVPPEQVAPLVHAGLTENLQPWISRDKSLDTKAWIAGAQAAMQFEGQTFGMPAYVVNYTYAYNQDILNERGIVPPGPDEWVSWDRIRDIGKRATKDTNGDGVTDIWGFFHDKSYTELIPLIMQAGGSIFDNKMMLNLDQPATYEGVNWLLDLMNSGIHGGSRADFYQNKVATMRLGSFEMNSIINAKTPVGVASGIQYKTKGEVAYVTSYVMSSSSAKKDAAWRFLKFITSKEAQEFVVARARIPMRRDVSLPTERKAVLQGFMNSLGTAQAYPYHVFSNYIQNAVNSGMTSVWSGQATPRNVIPELQRSINAYLQQNNK